MLEKNSEKKEKKKKEINIEIMRFVSIGYIHVHTNEWMRILLL